MFAYFLFLNEKKWIQYLQIGRYVLSGVTYIAENQCAGTKLHCLTHNAPSYITFFPPTSSCGGGKSDLHQPSVPLKNGHVIKGERVMFQETVTKRTNLNNHTCKINVRTLSFSGCEAIVVRIKINTHLQNMVLTCAIALLFWNYDTFRERRIPREYSYICEN